jgi:lipoprotein-anchoring transpeptidase ErfK/SrfK
MYRCATVAYSWSIVKTSFRDTGLLILALVVVAAVGYAAHMVVQSRASGGEPRQSLAVVSLPQPHASEAPLYERWTVGKVVRPTRVHNRPDVGSRVKARLDKVNSNGFPTLVLVDTRRTVDDATWYRVWLAKRPNGSRGWIREGDLAFYTTASKIEIDLSERRLTVYRRGRWEAAFPVAIGRPGLDTPTGFFFIDQKLRPPSPDGPYGVLALGISAFQPKLPDWPQGGPVAIHGTDREDLVGEAVSNGCLRMRNKDVLRVDELVPAGSPVIIRM